MKEALGNYRVCDASAAATDPFHIQHLFDQFL